MRHGYFNVLDAVPGWSNLIKIWAAGWSINIFDAIPMVNSGRVIPVILSVWNDIVCERFNKRYLRQSINTIVIPTLTIIVMGLARNIGNYASVASGKY